MPTTEIKSADTESYKEEIEGLGSGEDSSWGDYPIDELLIRDETRTVFEIVRRIRKGSFVMDPDFQRDFIWAEDKQSKLIESVLMRIPLPVFYLAEDDQGRMVVVDGLQRLSTFQRFFDNKLSLKLRDRPELHGKRFEDLSSKLQNRIEDCQLILYIIDAKVPERARLDIFERVNGGVPLTRQQMRNCLFMGPATRFLKEAAASDLFVKATGRSLNPKTMRDREFVNRFCSFHLISLKEYRGDMDDFLAEGLRRMNRFKTDQFKTLKSKLNSTLTNNLRVFGKHAFRKHTQHSDSRSVLNASLWDVMSTCLAEYPHDLVDSKAAKLRLAFFDLMDDVDFIKSITYAPNDTIRVKYRFETAREELEEVLGAGSP